MLLAYQVCVHMIACLAVLQGAVTVLGPLLRSSRLRSR
jgi:hypothetical protein